MILRRIDDLEKDHENATAKINTTIPAIPNAPLLLKNIEELKKTINLLRRGNEDFRIVNNELEEMPGDTTASYQS